MIEAMVVSEDAEGWLCEVHDGDLRVMVRLSAAAHGALAASQIAPADAARGFARSDLRRAQTWYDAATEAVARSHRRPRRVNDHLLDPFLQGGSGLGPRTDRDWAGLADFYLGIGKKNVRGLARDLAARHGRSARTWENDLYEAKQRFVEVVNDHDENGKRVRQEVLTDEGMRLRYGDDYIEQFAIEGHVNAAEDFIRRHGGQVADLSDPERSLAQFERMRYRAPGEMARRLAAARRIVDEAYPRRPGDTTDDQDKPDAE